MKLSIIIVNYNVRYFVEQCLLSVHQAIKNIDAEVFVVDNFSYDGSCEMIKNFFSWVYLIENKENVGFSVANNQAIVLSKGEYVLLLNPDTLVEENTFEKCIDFMDKHPNAGGLGVKMIDGKGQFLPESKRGLPTPKVAFYKVFGFSKLFPKSKKMGRYHLSYLDNDKIHEIDILAGAYMWMRKSVLDKVGLLDETFFMYGEDIDLSWRIRLAGYKNYYFPHTRVIHYKGESTKKESVNYIFMFYNAMNIFAKKYFSSSFLGLYTIFIQFAIYFRAILSIVKRIVIKTWIPCIDFLLINAIFLILTNIYGFYFNKNFKLDFLPFMFAGYGTLYILSFYYFGVYDSILKYKNILKSILFSSLSIVFIYAILSENYRFSRFVVFFSLLIVAISILLLRKIYEWGGVTNQSSFKNKKRIAIISKFDEYKNIKKLIQKNNTKADIILDISPDEQDVKKSDIFIGRAYQLISLVELFNINEIIFSSNCLSSQDIIKYILNLANSNVSDYKIIPKNTSFLIGSNSIYTFSPWNTFDFDNLISTSKNKRIKRIFDILCSFLIIILFPFIFWKINISKESLFKNALKVLFGLKTWIGYVKGCELNFSLPKLKPYVFEVKIKNIEKIEEQNVLYSNKYKIKYDILSVLNSIF